MPDSPLVFVSLSTRNYLHRARAMFASVAQHQPDAHRVLLVVDAITKDAPPDEALFRVIPVSALGLAGLRKLAFAVDPTTLCCALKSPLILHAMQVLGYSRVIYVDNDVLFYRPPSELIAALNEAPLVVTPHILGPLPSEAKPDEATILASGAFNAGLYATRAQASTVSFFSWWARMMSDPANLRPEWSCDQGWLAYGPVFVPGTRLLIHPGYNVSSWNLWERPLQREGAALFAGPAPLVAFHFSGFNEESPHRLHAGNPACNYPDHPLVDNVLADYLALLRHHGADASRAMFCAYTRYTDGRPVLPAERARFAREEWANFPSEADPFDPATLRPHRRTSTGRLLRSLYQRLFT